jgi:hypothetical protein
VLSVNCLRELLLSINYFLYRLDFLLFSLFFFKKKKMDDCVIRSPTPPVLAFSIRQTIARIRASEHEYALFQAVVVPKLAAAINTDREPTSIIVVNFLCLTDRAWQHAQELMKSYAQYYHQDDDCALQLGLLRRGPSCPNAGRSWWRRLL